jgi:PAS domain S-box-containing protein
VTYYDRENGDLFIQDSTAGMWIEPLETPLLLHSGEFVQIEGISGVGGFTPDILHPRFQVLGEAPLPTPQRTSSDELASGKLDSQWIEMEAVVRSVAERDGGLVLNVSSGAFECRVFVQKCSSLPPDIIDARVRVRGVFSGLYDHLYARIVGLQVLTPSWSNVKVVAGPAETLWSAPVHPLSRFLRWTPEGAFTHRVRVQGVVTFDDPGDLLGIRDAEGALLVHTTQPIALNLGDRIDALGYPAIGIYSMVMRDAVVQKLGAGPAPEPVAVDAQSEQVGIHDADLVRLSALLLNCTTRPGEKVLEMRAGGNTFRAVLETKNNSPPLRAPPVGSRLQLTGIMVVEADQNREPKGFHMLLRSRDDVEVLELPSWWTAGRALRVLGVLAIAVILALGWIAALKRRVREQTEILRLKYERELALEEQYRDLFENASDLIQAVDAQGRLLYVNPAWRKTLGYSAEEVANLSIQDIFHPNSREHCLEIFRRLRSGETFDHLEAQFISKSGELVVVEGSADCKMSGGKVVSTHSILRNVTERRRAEEARSFLACIVESSDYAIFGTDLRGAIVSWNGAAKSLFGYEADEIVGRHISLLVPPEGQEDVPRILGQVARGERISHHETRALRKDGERVDISLTVSPLRNADDAVIGGATIAHDISSRKQAELELQKAKEDAEAANRAKSEFLANMSHEIRTPMNGVLGMTELALGTELTSEQREYLDMVKISADTLLTVINDILDFSKIEAGKLDLDVTAFRLRESLDRILAPLHLRARQKGLELLCDVCPEVPEELLADRIRLTQVLGNLLGNALKFTSQGEVELKVLLESRQADGATLHFAVRDTGIGIPVAKQKSIFEAFAQADGSTSRRYGGTGLGLTICSRLVEMMGGRIWVESQPGYGSCFHFTVRVGLAEGAPDLVQGNQSSALKPHNSTLLLR